MPTECQAVCFGLWSLSLIQKQNFPRARGVKCGESCGVLQVGIWQTSATQQFYRALQRGCMINRNSKKLSCFPVILFYQNTLPSHFYDTILFLPNSTSLPASSIAYPKSSWTHCEAIYIPSLPKNVSIPNSVCFNTLGKFPLWGKIPGTIIPWPLLRRYYPREEIERHS